MSGKVISFGLQKGGVAKTTTTYNISAILAKMGYKVLMVDNDPQTSLTYIAGFRNFDELQYSNLSQVYSGEKEAKDIMLKVECVDNLYLLPSHIALSLTEMKLNPMMSRELVLAKILAPLKQEFDFICVDCPPSLGLLNMNNVAASDGIIYCCEPATLAVQGLALYHSTVAEIKRGLNLDTTFLGLIITKVGKGNDCKDIVNLLKKNFPVLGEIKQTVEVSKREMEGIPLSIAKPSHINSIAHRDIAEKIVEWAKNN